RRMSPPEVADPVKLKDVFAMNADQRIVLSEVEDELMLKDVIASKSHSVVLTFGPEGGWKEEELAAFTNAGWKAASLGNTILRAETAVIAAVAVVASLF